MASISEDFYDMGAALRELATARLYTSVGCKSFDELLRKYGPRPLAGVPSHGSREGVPEPRRSDRPRLRCCDTRSAQRIDFAR
jgi:hypothetical protein